MAKPAGYEPVHQVIPSGCIVCLERLTPMKAPGRVKLYCSRKCRDRMWASRRTSWGGWTRPCDQCGAPFKGPSGRIRCDRCAVLPRRHTPASPPQVIHGPPGPRVCQHCSGPFPGSSRRRAYCSARCADASVSPRIMGLYRAAMAALEIPKASMWRHRLCVYLAERDGGACHLCHKRIDLSLPSGPRGSDRGPSIDHVIPVANGGTDDLANLALAHWKCNRDKGTDPMGEQLQLVG